MRLQVIFFKTKKAILTFPDWCGVKMIYAPLRNVAPEAVAKYFKNADLLVKELPDFIIGFDLVGQEDLGKPLVDFLNQILAGKEKYPDLKIFFHAGKPTW